MKNIFLKKLGRLVSESFILVLLFLVFTLLSELVAASINPTGNTISGGNSNYINLSNSGSYPITLDFSGTLSTGDVVYLDIMSGSTIVKSYTGSNDGSGSKTFITDLSSGISNGALTFSGSIFASGSVNPYVTGISGTGTGDFISPTALIDYSNTGITNPPIVATLTGANEAITVTNNSGVIMKSFAANGLFIFNFIDSAGNTGTTNAIVNNINTISPLPINLGSTANFAILSKTAITNVPSSAITGDVGSSPVTGAALAYHVQR